MPIMPTFNLIAAAHRHNRAAASAALGYGLGAAAAWLVTFGIIWLITWIPLRLRSSEVSTAAHSTLIIIFIVLLAAESLRRYAKQTRLRAAARAYLRDGPEGFVDADKVQRYLASRMYSDRSLVASIFAQIIMAAPALTASAQLAWSNQLPTDRTTLEDARTLFEELGNLHAWAPLSDYAARGDLLWILHNLDLLWLRFTGDYPEIRLAADIAHNYFPPPPSNV